MRLYLGLIIAQRVYVFLFLKALLHLVMHAWEFTEQQIMLVVLGLIDLVMISNLLIMVIIGGYETFVSRLGLQGHRDQPEWLSHLLRTFIEASASVTPGVRLTEAGVMWQSSIHGLFTSRRSALPTSTG